MSIVELRVELPTYAQSFVIEVPESCTILEVKQEISKKCPGQPKVEAQKLIWRGRYLVDGEKVEDLWKTTENPRVVHLAVHPSGWSGNPPEVKADIPPVQHIAGLPELPAVSRYHVQHSALPSHSVLNRQASPVDSNPTQKQPLHYIVNMHHNALLALKNGIKPPNSVPNDSEVHTARRIMESHGFAWPAVFDEEYPEPSGVGVRYEQVILDGQPYLSLCDSYGQPTAMQVHALKVLSYTFTLLSMNLQPTAETITVPQGSIPLPADIDRILQEAAIAQLRLANPAQDPLLPRLREIPLRPLVAPFLMLLFRTVLLLYFVAPARKPIFGILILAWMMYEIWQPIRMGLMRGLQRGAEELQRQDPAPGARQQEGPGQNPQQPGVVPNPQQAEMGRGGLPGARLDTQVGAIVDTLGNMNIGIEEQILNQIPGAPLEEPSLTHKVITFFGLLITTVHPAVWNRRRAALRRREGTIRTEAQARDAGMETEGEQHEDRATQLRNQLREQYNRRPRWVQRYMERVVREDWVDDAD